ncbi:ROK family protein [Paenibacillus sp. CC-CFT747]|nr:ROK family protein [Paenibacillus sp. CC-CFT747]
MLLNSSRFCAIGIQLAGTSARGTLYNFQHTRLAEAEGKEKHYDTEEDLLRVIRGVIDQLISQAPDPACLKGIGFSVHGLVDSSEGFLLRSPGLGWKRIPLAKLLEAEYGLPVFLENDTNLLALHENIGGILSSSKNNLTLKFDRGIGGAIVVEKRLVTGSSFVAGEVGHYKAFMPPYDYECYCGGRGCLTTLASSRGLQRTLGRSREEFHEAVRNGNPETVQLSEAVRTAIVYAAANIVTLLNPDRVLLTGAMLPVWGDSYVDELQARVMALVPQTCRNVEFVHLPEVEDETALAAGLVEQSVFKIPLDSLSL